MLHMNVVTTDGSFSTRTGELATRAAGTGFGKLRDGTLDLEGVTTAVGLTMSDTRDKGTGVRSQGKVGKFVGKNVGAAEMEEVGGLASCSASDSTSVLSALLAPHSGPPKPLLV
jgi:hypothetical protein